MLHEIFTSHWLSAEPEHGIIIIIQAVASSVGSGDMIYFKCPICGEEIEAPTSMQGETLACPACSQYALVPGSDDTVILNGEPTEISSEDTHVRLNRISRMNRECQKALKRNTKISLLMEDICHIVVDIGGYRLAWVGLAEYDENKTVRPVAQRGFERDYLNTVNITWADTERGRGPTGAAIRSAKPVVNQNVLENPHYKPWRDQARKRGYASSIALPLITEEQVLGALNIYSSRPQAFDDDEVQLLMKMANLLAHGVMTLLKSKPPIDEEISPYHTPIVLPPSAE